MKRRLLAGREQVDARREDTPHGVRHREPFREHRDLPPVIALREHAAVDQRLDQLLDEERISLRTADEELAHVLRQISDELRGDVVGKRLELDRGHVPASATPLELGPRGRNDWAACARFVQQVDPGVPEAVTGGERVQVAADVAAERQAEDRAVVELGDFPEMLLQNLSDGPVGPRRPVREAPADAERRALRASGEPGPQLADQTALAHAGFAEDECEPWLTVVDGTFVRTAERVELATAADERALLGAAGPDCRERTDEEPAGDGFALALRLDVLQRTELERAPCRLRRPLADEDLAGLRRLLEASAHVHGVAGDEGAVRLRVDDHLARVHADPQRERRLQLGEPLAHREGGVQRALRMVLERRGSAKRRHHGVAGELLDRASDPLDLLGHRREEAVEEHPHPLRVGLAEAGRADEVGEQHGCDLPLHAPILPPSGP